MTWDYRIVRRSYPDPHGSPETQYEIHEAYYDAWVSVASKPRWISADGIAPVGETLEELKTELASMILAFNRPALDYETLEEI